MSMFATEQAKSHDLSHQNEKDAAFCRLILQNKFLFPETGCIKSSIWVLIFFFFTAAKRASISHSKLQPCACASSIMIYP